MAKGIKTGGRTAGVVNKTTAEIREHFQNLVSNNLDQLNEDLKIIAPLYRIKLIIELAKFVVPTLKATELTTDKENGFSPIVINLGTGIAPERQEEIMREEINRINTELDAKY
jgi:hypothetical protein